MTTLEKTGWYISTSQFDSAFGVWFTRMDYVHGDRAKKPDGAWWHQADEEVDAVIRY